MPGVRVSKRVLLLIKYLDEELSECLDVCENARQEMEARIRKLHFDLNVFDSDLDRGYQDSDPGSDRQGSSEKDVESCSDDRLDEDCDVSKKSNPHPPWAKKLFKKIVFLTHPDKIPDGLNSDMKDRLVSLYQSAKESIDISDYVSVAVIAFDLDISPIEVDASCSGLFKKKEREILNEIASLKGTIYWVWSHSDEDQREKIMSQFLKSRGWDTSENMRKKSRKGPGNHPGKSISWIRKLEKKIDS